MHFCSFYILYVSQSRLLRIKKDLFPLYRIWRIVPKSEDAEAAGLPLNVGLDVIILEHHVIRPTAHLVEQR
jgi:hypothetical protein